jgi:Fe-S cluster assembly ATP-binding protein
MATNVLKLTRIENQTELSVVGEYNLSEQIRSAVLLLESKWEEKELELELEFEEYPIEADEELLKEVWINLVDNAVKFTPHGGSIVLDGVDITGLDVTERARRGISFGFQRPVAFKGFTVRDILNIAAGRELSNDELKMLLGKVGLCMHDYIDREINSNLSGGEQKRIEIAGVLARDTALNIFDEPEAGIDIWSFQRLISVFKELRSKGGNTQIIISHQRGILDIADEVLVICNGGIVNRGEPGELLPGLFGANGLACPVGRKCD